jgi:hypothetical protein
MFIAFAITLPPAHGATPDQIDDAISKGQKYLLGLQKPTGQWETGLSRVGTTHAWETMQGDTFGGYTALATYALLASGMSTTDPPMVKAIDFLRRADVIGIYALGMRANVWLLIPPTAQNRDWLAGAIRKDRDLLLNGLNTGEGPNQGFWQYGNGLGKRLDHSVSQYGVLGLWACDQAGAEIDTSVWRALDRHWREHQFPDGTWQYDASPTHPSEGHRTGTEPAMTAAGIATLFITQDYLYARKAAACNGNISNENIDKGLAWMAAHFDEISGMYARYGIERIGVASGRKYFGAHDWFAEVADHIVKEQQPDGSWLPDFIGSIPTSTAPYALLFLTRGRAPVMVNKLQYNLADAPAGAGAQPVEGHWNQRPRDVANVVRWFVEQSETDLNWQVVNLSVPATELAEAPVLYISGDTELRFTPAEQQKLRDFVYLGGSEAFSRSFQKLGSTLFQHEFRDLPQNHPIYNREQYPASRWKDRPRVLGLSNGIRELMLLVPQADAGRAWHVRADRTHASEFQLGANAFMYAVDKNPSVKGRTHIVEVDPTITPERTLRVARLEVGDNWDPEPGAWNRMTAVLHNQAKVGVTVTPVKLEPDALAAFKVAHLTGTTKISLTDGQRAALLEWVGHGGTLIVDAAGGSPDFAGSIEAELKNIFGADADKGLGGTLQMDHPMFGLPKMAIQEVTYRPYARNILVGDLSVPRIRAVQHGGRVEVFYSREDITEGLVGQKVDGVDGYSPQSATDLMRNMVLYAGFSHHRR